MKIQNRKIVAKTTTATLSVLDCKEAIAYWLRSKHGLVVGRENVKLIAEFDADWQETVFMGAEISRFEEDKTKPHLKTETTVMEVVKASSPVTTSKVAQAAQTD